MAIEVNAQTRTAQGKGASRRLRNGGKVPGIVYGGGKAAQPVELDHNDLFHQLRNEKFHASILTLAMNGAREQVLLRSFNMHPFKPQVQHVDFQRVSADEKIHMKVPLHFVNGESSVAVKQQGAVISHVTNELDIRCLPADLPEFIEVDLSQIAVGRPIHVRDLKLPAGVEAVLRGAENPPVVSAQVPRVVTAEEEAAAAAAAEGVPAPSEVPTVKQKAEPAEAAPAKEEKGARK